MTRVITYSESGYSTKLLSNNQHSIEYSYDAESRITRTRTKFSYLAGTALAGKTLSTTYNYSDNGTLSNCIINTDGLNINVTYTYDNYLRPSSKTIHEDDFTNVVTYGYYENDSVITNEITSYTSTVNGVATGYTYTYDGRGNIVEVYFDEDLTDDSPAELICEYSYNVLGQLTWEHIYNSSYPHSYEYTYDKAGNILYRAEWAYPDGEFIGGVYYTYDGDRLVSYNGQSITYDEYGRTSYYRGKQIYYSWDNRFNRIESFGNASFTYYEDGMRRTKTVGGVTHYYTYDGINLIKEEWGDNVLVFLYDADGSPIGMQYRTTSYDEGKWDTYYYEKNLQGDIIAVYSAAGTKLVTYTYDAWGYIISTTYLNGGSATGAQYNPLRYRGYYYDSNLALYYLATRYYDPEVCRFVTADDPAVLTATPMGLTDKNLYAYCDNNPVMRIDNGGEFWITVGKFALGLAAQYVGDIIGNVLDGKTGWEVLVPTSTAGEYIAAGVTAIIPGSGISGALISNIVSEGITAVEDVILGNEISVVDSMINICLGTALDVGFEKISNKVTTFIKSKEPRNYSSYAHKARQSNPNLTREQIYHNMQRSIKFNRATSKLASWGIDTFRCVLP